MTWTSEGERYRYAEEGDIPAIFEMLSDPEVGRWLWFMPASAEAITDFFTPLLVEQTRILESGETPQTAVFVVENAKGEFLGQGAVIAVVGSPGGFEIGYQLCRKAWGRGVGKRLAWFLTAYAVHCCKAYRVEASCMQGNEGSQRILESLGLRSEGAKPGYRLKDDKRHTELFYGAEVETLDGDAIAKLGRELGFL